METGPGDMSVEVICGPSINHAIILSNKEAVASGYATCTVFIFCEVQISDMPQNKMGGLYSRIVIKLVMSSSAHVVPKVYLMNFKTHAFEVFAFVL